LTKEDNIHFDTVKSLLNELEIPYTIDPLMVRGLDYYTRTTYEITSNSLGAQDALCGGGRYDNLVESLGGKPTPAVGFGAGMERLILALGSILEKEIDESATIQLIALSEKTLSNSQVLANKLRKNNFLVSTDMLRRSLKANLREANRTGVKIAIIIGDDEASENSVQVKGMQSGEQKKISIDKLIPYLSNLDL
jgi:histidyl-tRNA synthetase